jgi:hypothetical protein
MKSKTPTLDRIHEIESKHSDATEAMSRLLQDRGWTYSSSNPICCWFWEKQLPDGRTVMVHQETAVLFEQRLCGEEYDND